MNVDLGPRAEAFRQEVREWLEYHKPEGLEEMDERAAFMLGMSNPALRSWMQELREGGFLCVSWPKEFGGRGLTGVEVAALNEEFARACVPRVTLGMGENLVGPSVIVHGTDEQKAHFLPRIISGQDRYCQGFSEPNHGSDLAAVETRGTVDGDEIVIEGQKVWTSGAHLANMIFLLCRTDPAAPKHRGISYVLAPMKDNNIETRPLRQITGDSGFCETFFSGARAPLFNVIGGLNNGWRVAMTTLGNERGGSATIQHLRYQREVWELIDLARKSGKSSDAVFRQKLAWAYSQVEVMRFSGLRLLATIAAKREPGPEASINKLFWSEYHKRFGEIAMELVGPDAMVRPAGDRYSLSRWQQAFLGSRAGTIFSGTSQIQRNIIGERALGLPKEPSADVSRETIVG
jgi:alkylation response protein AidB-like acyl-CoA dehydrogenase